MENIAKIMLYMEYEKFASNPNDYFTNITNIAIGCIRKEYNEYDVAKVLKQLKFFNVFVESLDKLTPENVGKVLKLASKEKFYLFQWLFSRIAIFGDLLESGVFEGDSVLHKGTNETHTVLFGIQSHLNLVYKFVSGFLERYNPESTINENVELIDKIGMSIVVDNPKDFDPMTKSFLRKDDPSESLYS